MEFTGKIIAILPRKEEFQKLPATNGKRKSLLSKVTTNIHAKCASKYLGPTK